MKLRLKIYKNLIVGVDLLRRSLISLKHFPTLKEAKNIIAEEDPYNEEHFFEFSAHSQTNVDEINANLRKVKLHLDILFSYIHTYALQQIDRFIHNVVRIENINNRLNRAAVRVGDWVRSVQDKSINYIERMHFFSSEYMVPGFMSGVEVDHRMGQLRLIRKSSRPIFIGDASVTYTKWGEESKINLTGGGLLSSLLNSNVDTYFGGEIVTPRNTGQIMFYLAMKRKERFNRIDVELTVPGTVRIYNRGRLLGSDEDKSEGLYHVFTFPYIGDDSLGIEIQTKYARVKGAQNVFDFGVRSIKLSVCTHSKNGYAYMQSVILDEATTADTLVIESKTNNIGKVSVDITKVEGGDGANLLNDTATVNIGSRLYIDNTDFYGPVEINPPRIDELAILSNPSIYTTVEGSRDPICGTQLYSIPLSLLSEHPDAVIADSIRIIPFLDTCTVETYVYLQTSYTPTLEDWYMFSSSLKGALTDDTMEYNSYTMPLQNALSPKVFLQNGRHTKIEFFVRALEDIRLTIRVKKIDGIEMSYYFDSKLVGHGPDLPLFIKEGGWHKFTICLYVDSVDPTKSTIEHDVFGQLTHNLLYLANIVNAHRVAVSSLKTGELPYVPIEELPFTKGHRFSVDYNNNILTTVNCNVGTTVLTWKELKSGLVLDITNPSVVRAVSTKINLSTEDVGITPTVDDIIVVVGSVKGRDPLLIPRK